MAGIQIERVTKRFADVVAVRDLSLAIDDREFVTLLGPSGCGKTTLLRLLAGFMAPDAGVIRVGATVLSSPSGVVPPERRGMGMVFQNYAVWPHRTVAQNVAFGLEVRRVPRAEARTRIARILELVNLAGLERRYPSELSGGQQQRVALARSLVVEPGILLLDEPLSNLDAKLRERMRWELKELQRRTGITFVYVTHDQSEALALSDRIAVMHRGEVMQFGPPREVYTRPTSKTVADFMGLVNLVPGRVARAGGERSVVALGDHRTLAVALPPGTAEGQTVHVAVRPESLRLSPPSSTPAANGVAALPGRVTELTFLGNLTDCHVTLDDGTRVRVQLDPRTELAIGQRVEVDVDPAFASVFTLEPGGHAR
jgi:iron(III) transport system ATP-binding protein